MPYILDDLGNEPSKSVHQAIDRPLPPPSIAWALDPYAPVPSEYEHLVKDPNEERTTDEQKEAQ